MDGQARLSHNGYLVVPGALRNAQKTYDVVAASWDTLRENILSWTLADGDLGLLGRLAGVVGDYNAAFGWTQKQMDGVAPPPKK